MSIQIQISDEVWFQLKNMKVRPSETFSEIIENLINQNKKGGRKNEMATKLPKKV